MRSLPFHADDLWLWLAKLDAEIAYLCIAAERDLRTSGRTEGQPPSSSCNSYLPIGDGCSGVRGRGWGWLPSSSRTVYLCPVEAWELVRTPKDS